MLRSLEKLTNSINGYLEGGATKTEYSCPQSSGGSNNAEQNICTWDNIPDDIKLIINNACSDYNLTKDEKFELYKESINKIAFDTLCFQQYNEITINKDEQTIKFELANDCSSHIN